MSGDVEILRLPQDRDRWEHLLGRVDDHDIYHRPEYLALFDDRRRPGIPDAFFGRPCLFVLEDDSGLALHPLLERPLAGIPGLEVEDGGLHDLVSPYGYAGPLLEAAGDADRAVLAARFEDRCADRCRRDRTVAEFVRFHPVLGNAAHAARTSPDRRGDVVVADLRRDDHGLLAAMSQSTRSMIRGSGRRGVEVAAGDGDGPATLERLYLDAMRRRGAAPEYFLPSGFFSAMVEGLAGSVVLLVAREAGRAVAAAIFTARGTHASYSFAAIEARLPRSPAGRTLVYEGMRWARDRGCSTMILGGGVGAGTDGLLRFKRFFSRGSRPFHTAGRIHLPEVYHELSLRRRSRIERSGEPTRRGPGYFPEYRR